MQRTREHKTSKSIYPPFFEALNGKIFKCNADERLWILLPTERIANSKFTWSIYHAWAGMKGYNPYEHKDFIDGYVDRDWYNPLNYYQSIELTSVHSEQAILAEITSRGYSVQ